ncbi:SusE domain-containing protein [Gaetbulibacter sp. NE]|uniref:SusE domain-containing protein n=1 Tax=Gaetbulibacter sp. NE TaxID=2982307 RepID=UPI0021CF5970|nr:SusE domain-containing protein [Gaetbulibacter sp. NE]
MKTKKIFIALFVVLLGFTFISCDTDDNLQPEGQWELSSPEILLPTSEPTIVLDESTPNETITFSWEAAKSSAGYAVTYEVFIDNLNGDFTSPFFSSVSSNNGSGTSLSVSYEELNEALAYGGYPANSEAHVAFAIKATSLSKTSQSTRAIKVVRFENEIIPQNLYLSGSATENGEDLSQGIQLRRLSNSSGSLSNIHEIYTSLVAGETYKFYSERSLPALQFGGSDGNLESFGDPIIAETSGQFRVKVDLDNNTYELLQINFWSMVGTPIAGGWGGDEPLDYQGNSVWRASINLLETGGFVFRANGDWGYLLKRVVGTQNTVVLESDAANQGVTYEDIPNNQTGQYFVTLDLSAENYTYSFEVDDSVVDPIDTPAQLFLLENGSMIEEFSLSGDVFSSNRFIPMQASNTYTLNSASDGSGTSYSVNGLLAESVTPDADIVSDALTLVESSDNFTVFADRALRFSIDFSAPALNWTYYNFKLFHWQVWDDREEFPMTYAHPNTFTVTTDLIAGSESKFISPWDFDLGSDNPSSLTGNLINGGGSNLLNINTDGTYTVTIILNDDYQTGSYEFAQ